MKKRLVFLFIMLFVAFQFISAIADGGLLPKSYTLFGVVMPDIRFAIGREADEVETGYNGERLVFNAFSEAE